jgi:hypothetical protein
MVFRFKFTCRVSRSKEIRSTYHSKYLKWNWFFFQNLSLRTERTISLTNCVDSSKCGIIRISFSDEILFHIFCSIRPIRFISSLTNILRIHVGFEVLTAVVMKSSIFWDITAELYLPPSLMLVCCLAYSSTLKTEVTCSSETSVHFQRSTQRYISEYKNLPPSKLVADAT